MGASGWVAGEALYEKTNHQLPLGLHIQADNCSREGKNQYVIKWCALNVLIGTFRWISLGFLRTGHSGRPGFCQ